MTGQLHLSIFIASIINFSSHCCIVATTLSLSYWLGHQLVLALFGVEVPRVVDYLQTNVFLDLVVVEQEECPHALQKKATREATSKVIRETAG